MQGIAYIAEIIINGGLQLLKKTGYKPTNSTLYPKSLFTCFPLGIESL